ncbi:MAG: PadR family transcriptional regulator, regulatory protein PadR [Gaiellaceae bacterium]|jgi:PadR family transcriptional regulator PadR|nr:PadR family transcriptional regulator, regulatory protein PadR [Gaiellaceae bacterium]
MGAEPNRRSQILRGVLDVCVLAVIADGPAYGYEMTKRLVERGLSPVSEGSIYPILGRFEAQGLVETYREGSNGGPPRKYYSLSASGRDALAAWSGEWRHVRTAVDAVLSNQTEVRS